MADYWTDLRRRRLSRQRFLVGAGLTAAGGAGALVLGCSSSTNNAKPTTAASASAIATRASSGGTAPTSAPASGSGTPAAAASATSAATQVKTGGTLKTPDSGAPDLFDPAITVSASSFGQGTTMSLIGLLRYDEQFKVFGYMADMPQQPDPLTYVFKLQPGIKWHNLPPANARSFTAEDAVYGLKRFTQSNPEFIYGASLSPIDKYEAIDPQTFKITLKAPYAPLLAAIADDWCMMVNREQVDKVGDAGIKKYENLLGTGPWVRGELKQNVSSSLVKNPDYFVKGQPYLDRIEWTIIADPNARWAAFRSKQSDTSLFWGGFVTKQEADQIKSELGDKVVSQTKRAVSFRTTVFNTERDPFKDPRVRRAFFLAIDRQAMDVARGKGNLALMAAVPQALTAYTISETELLTLPGYRQPKDQDIADAKKLLAAAGVTGTLKVALRSYPSVSFPEVIALQASLKSINVEAELQDSGDILADRAKGNFEFLFASTVGAPDPDPFLYNQFHSQGTANYSKYKNPDFDKLAETQRQELDTAKRKQIVRDAQNLLLQEAPMAFTFSSVYYPTAWSYVKGWRIIPSYNLGWVSAEVWLDKT